MGLVVLFQQEMPVFQQNKHLTMPDRDTVKTGMRRETWRDTETPDTAKTETWQTMSRDKTSVSQLHHCFNPKFDSELSFYILLDTKSVILEMFFPANLVAQYWRN